MCHHEVHSRDSGRMSVWGTLACSHSFIHSKVYPSIHSFIRSFVRSFTHLFIGEYVMQANMQFGKALFNAVHAVLFLVDR